jgi:hypothetical protein
MTLDISNLLYSKNICWYPSAGTNFTALNFWNKQIGNEINPQHFVFTDSIYNVSNIDSYSLSLSEQLNCEKDKIKTSIIETSFNAFLTKDENYRLLLKKYLNDLPEDPKVKEIREILFLNRDEEIMEFDSIYFNQNAILIKIEINEITLWLLNIKNEDFYSFCINEELIVNTLMLYRHMDNFIYDNESDIIEKIFVKEILTSRSYLNYSKGVKKESIIPWDSEFNDQNFINGPDRICYFKVC